MTTCVRRTLSIWKTSCPWLQCKKVAIKDRVAEVHSSSRRVSRSRAECNDIAAVVTEQQQQQQQQSQFGSRFLTDDSKVFDQNAWDDVSWEEEDRRRAKEKIDENLSSFVSSDRRRELEENAADNWNQFFAKHEDNFFKDRKWIFRVFPELGRVVEASGIRKGDEDEEEDGSFRPIDATAYTPSSLASTLLPRRLDSSVHILEVGCGVGNVVFPILKHFPENQNLFVFCCDFAQNAIDLLKKNENFDEKRCFPFQWDLTDAERELPVRDGTLDFITMIFVLSAIDPSHFSLVLTRLTRLLRPGGRILFRDYGRYDMAQLRFKSGSAIAENFYVRGDGTRAYFFTREEIRALFTSELGLEEEFCHIDNRLLVNRARQLKMYRVWLLAQFRKPLMGFT